MKKFISCSIRGFQRIWRQITETPSGTGTAARLGEPEFDAAVKALRVDYGMNTDQLVTFMNDGTAARVQDEQFQVAMRKVIDSTGVPCAVTLFNRGSFNCRIVDVVDDFCALVKHCDSNGSGPQDVVTMLGNSKLNSVIPQLRQQLSNVHGDNLRDAMAEFAGSYTHKSKKAEELMA